MTTSQPQEPEGLLPVTQEDRAAVADQAEAFGRAFHAEQQANFGCAGAIECTHKMDGNCYCFNVALARHRLSALPPQPNTEGWQYVPKEATEAMFNAGALAILDGAGDPEVLAVLIQEARQCWSAMLSASPAPPEEGA